MTHADDLKIVQSVLAGNKESYAILVRTYQGRIIKVCQMLLLNPTEAEDVAQNVFVKAYQSLSDFRGDSSFSTWIYRIARNCCMDEYRKKKRQRTDSLDDLLDQNQNGIGAIPEHPRETAATEENKDLINKILISLRPDHKNILILREVTGLTYQEIASYLNCSIDAVKARLRRAREDMQEKARHFSESETV